MDITMSLSRRLSHRLSQRQSLSLSRRKLQVRPWQMLSGQAAEPETVAASENAPAP